MNKQAFVIMPIGDLISEDGKHFLTIYSYIKSSLEECGYSVMRADEVQKSGAITKDIITRLAEADLVVADLTDLNPNVFYELGVRHVLRGAGTIMILDQDRPNSRIPFDLGTYRVLKFSSTLEGIKDLSSGLSEYSKEIGGIDPSNPVRDNPVHDWLPSLPLNAVSSASGSEAGAQRKKIKELEIRLERYEESFGLLAGEEGVASSPLAKISSILRDAEDGLLPASVFQSLGDITKEGDVIKFLKALQKMMDRNVALTPSNFLTLSRYCQSLALDDARKAVLEYALDHYPKDNSIKGTYYTSLTHSPLASDRQKARTEILKLEGIEIKDGKITGLRTDINVARFAILFDAYHEDGMYEQALELSTEALKVIKNDSKILRNHARNLNRTGHHEEAMSFYKAAIFGRGLDDTTAAWLSAELKGEGDLDGAIEARALSCVLDPNDSNNFVQLIFRITEREQSLRENVNLEYSVTDGIYEAVKTLISCSISCDNVADNINELIQIASGELGLSLSADSINMDREKRAIFSNSFYKSLSTALTDSSKSEVPNRP